mgnify:FL=1
MMMERESLMNAWDKDYVSGLVDGKGNLIDDSADSQSFLKAFDLQKYVGTPKEKEDIVDKPQGKKAQLDNIVESSPEVNVNIIKQIRGVYPTMPEAELFRLISIKYPRKETESSQDYLSRIGGMIKEVYEEEKKNKISDDNLKKFFDTQKDTVTQQNISRSVARKGKSRG